MVYRGQDPPEGSWNPLGSLLAIVALILHLFLPPGGLLERSWTPSGPIQSALERPLGVPRRISRQFLTILGAKRLPKRSPRGSKIDSKRRLALKTRFLHKVCFFSKGFHRFLRCRGRFLGVKIDAKRHQIAAWLRDACQRLLFCLLERSWRPSGPKKVLLIGSWVAFWSSWIALGARARG